MTTPVGIYATSIEGTRHPFSLRPNKQEAVVTGFEAR